MVWQSGNIICSSVAYDFSEPNSLIDDTIKLTEFNNDQFPKKKSTQLICFQHVNNILQWVIFVLFYFSRNKHTDIHLRTEKKSLLLFKRRFGNSSNNSSTFKKEKNKIETRKQKTTRKAYEIERILMWNPIWMCFFSLISCDPNVSNLFSIYVFSFFSLSWFLFCLPRKQQWKERV